jgi:ATP-dependent DNA helicase DinG
MVCPDAVIAPPPRGAGQPAAAAIAEGAREAIAREIALAGGAEVVFFGTLNVDGLVGAVEVAARGHMTAAPALVARANGHDVAIHNHPSGVLLPSDADLAVAVGLAERGVGTMIVSNCATRVHVVVPPHRRTTDPLDPDDVAALLAPGGPIAHALGAGYEGRPGQVDMARRVARAFRDEQVALLEAGTGTGKTFAYLVPAALHALQNRERVVVSTATIHLQEQVSRKDVPLVRRALTGLERHGRPLPRLEAVVLKGRSNYVSLRRAEEAAAQDAALFGNEQERVEVERLAAWARTTPTGDKSELLPPPTPEAWEHVESQGDNCLRAACPRFDRCHYFESRRAAARAQLVIVNHHLLFSDLAIKEQLGTLDASAVLPPFERVILDEGHHVEQVAGEHFGVAASEHGVMRALGRLQRRRDARRGVLPGLAAALVRVPGDAASGLARAVEEELIPLRDIAATETESAFASVAAAVRAALPAGEQGARDAKLRLGAAHAPLLAPLLEAGRGLAQLAARLEGVLEQAGNALDDEQRAPVANLLREAAAAGRRLARAADALGTFRGLESAAEQTDPVRWSEVERDRRGQDRLTLRAVPLETGPLVRKALLDPMRTVVLTSATLTVERRFDFLERRLGLASGEPLAEGRLARARIASPFDYGRQALLAVPTDLPLPDAPGWDEALAAALLAVARRTHGRMFALFTSYGALMRAHRALVGPLEASGLVALRQGESGRTQLLERFKATPGAVLFGTDSFWEGVDVPGDGLVLVAITRLPFRVPSEPLQEARAEAIARRGGDAFNELQLPQAALKLTQGFGRLIRTSTDRGAVLVLDRRLVARAYGQRFMDSLPPVRVAVQPVERLLETIEPFTNRT